MSFLMAEWLDLEPVPQWEDGEPLEQEEISPSMGIFLLALGVGAGLTLIAIDALLGRKPRAKRSSEVRISQVFGLWLWHVPVKFDLSDVRSAPEEDWTLIRVWAGDFRDMSMNRAKAFVDEMARREDLTIPCPAIIGIATGTGFILDWYC